jgi:hypothetical protein
MFPSEFQLKSVQTASKTTNSQEQIPTQEIHATERLHVISCNDSKALCITEKGSDTSRKALQNPIPVKSKADTFLRTRTRI